MPSKYGPGSSPPGGAIPEGGIAVRLLPRCVRPALLALVHRRGR